MVLFNVLFLPQGENMSSLYDLIIDDEKLEKDKRSLDDNDNQNGGNKKVIPTIEDIVIGINKLNENITNISTEIRVVTKSLNETRECLLKSTSETEKRIIEKIPEEIETLIGNGKITAELDKRSKTFITAGGIASFVFAILVIIIGIWGNKYVQEANKYENLMAVFDVMPKAQYDQIQTWVQTSYQNINPSKNDTPIPSK